MFLGCSIEEFESIRKTVNSPLPMADKDDSKNDCSAMEDDDMNFDSDSLASENLTEDSADNSDQFSLSSNLASWVNKYRPSRETTNELLKILISNELDLPRDCRTLLKTPRNVDTIDKCGGTYFYNGIEQGVLVAIDNLKTREITKIELSLNIDGVPLAKSTNSQLWPILGSINNSEFVFIIAMFHGMSPIHPVFPVFPVFL